MHTVLNQHIPPPLPKTTNLSKNLRDHILGLSFSQPKFKSGSIEMKSQWQCWPFTATVTENPSITKLWLWLTCYTFFLWANGVFTRLNQIDWVRKNAVYLWFFLPHWYIRRKGGIHFSNLSVLSSYSHKVSAWKVQIKPLKQYNVEGEINFDADQTRPDRGAVVAELARN